MSQYFSELGQDKIVDTLLKQKINGTFVDIGACYYNNNNNSYFFEKERNFRGVAVELNVAYTFGWTTNRPNSVLIVDDATKLDYQKVFDDNNLPQVIDFLSIDIDPTSASFDSLVNVMKSDRTFNAIAFEVDYFKDPNINTPNSFRDRSRDLLAKMGYIFITEVHTRGLHIDDIYVHNSIYDSSIVIG